MRRFDPQAFGEEELMIRRAILEAISWQKRLAREVLGEVRRLGLRPSARSIRTALAMSKRGRRLSKWGDLGTAREATSKPHAKTIVQKRPK
jgi:hypothetical protein